MSLETLILLLYPLGLWLSFPLCPWRVTLLDSLVFLVLIKKYRVILARNVWSFWLFVGALLFSYFFAFRGFQSSLTVKSLLYLARTIVYYGFLVAFLARPARGYRQVIFWASWWLVIIGLGQYLLVRDFLSWQVLGWDPHLGRLVGSWYDPGFLATAYLLLLVFWQPRRKVFWQYFFWLLLWLAFLFTFSRSLWLLGLGWLLGQRRYCYLGIIVFLVILLLAVFTNFSEGTRIYRWTSVVGRWQNGKQALAIFRQHPLTGIGFNNLAFWRQQRGINFGHANQGFENSFLFLLATGGLVVLVAYLIFLYHWGKRLSWRGKTIFILWLLSGLFNNTLFYPLLIVLVAFLLAGAKDDRLPQ